jgi:hypothetical protein
MAHACNTSYEAVIRRIEAVIRRIEAIPGKSFEDRNFKKKKKLGMGL